MRLRSSPERPTSLHLQGVAGGVSFDRPHRCSGAGQRTLGLRPPHEAGQRAAELLRVELIIVRARHQELRRSFAIGGLEGGVGPDAAEPIGSLELTAHTGTVQWRPSIVVGGVQRGALTVQPPSYVEVTLLADYVQRCHSRVVGGVERSARAVQPLGYVEEAPVAGGVQQCPSIAAGGGERGARAV
eukprot:scaffold34441_cov61-Phaeocystis_antarctica.AAC.2